MGWIESLHGATVGLDTAPLIYWIEKHPTYAAKLKPFFGAGATWFLSDDVHLPSVPGISFLFVDRLPAS